MDNQINTEKEFSRLINIINELREKCPWDKKQTFESLSHLTIEEVYELTESIRDNNPNELKKELGDVMMHLVFYSKIASEKQLFTIEDVLKSLNKKLIDRHPHIYDPNFKKAETDEEVKKIWEQTKLNQGAKSVLSGVPKHLPALVKAFRLQEKASGIGFKWKNDTDAWEKVQEEIEEFKEAIQHKNQKEKEAEFGDVLFSLINYAKYHTINPEQALQKTNDKFINRFKSIENLVREDHKVISDLNINEMMSLWTKAKEIELKKNK